MIKKLGKQLTATDMHYSAVTTMLQIFHDFQANLITVSSGFRCHVEICALLGCYAASSGNLYRRFGTTYRFHLQGSGSPRRCRWYRYVVPKRRERITTRCCVISQKSADLKPNHRLHVVKVPQLVDTLCHTKSFQRLPLRFFKLQFNIIMPLIGR